MIRIDAILKKITHQHFAGNVNELVSKPSALDVDNTDPHLLMWVSNKNIEKLEHINCGTIICSSIFKNYKAGCNYIQTENPRLTFQEILTAFFLEKPTPVISSTAAIDPSVVIGKNAFIGHHVVIEKGCIIGDEVEIGHQTVLMRDTVIHNHVKIGSNCTIGGVGFGYEQNESKEYVLIPHLGNVVLKDFVEIGNNTCIDRAVLGSTILQENSKVDNLVHIAHGVIIGKNSLIIANSMIAGSTIIGDNVWVAPSASVLNKKTVGNNSVIGMGAVVIKDVKDNETIIGNPGKALVKSENKS
ncbi:MAG: UDP-3-O-(3-hydroxymyristoyl)glucosamine N-acyltransferase [Cyclobacteriaceae bacterium]|nr:UDP-3-O-(3-hydroxymyristoyl)glucosamine N-acyltransferase [Cyclobacteriaceae bacterium]